jgi:MFS family permease
MDGHTLRGTGRVEPVASVQGPPMSFQPASSLKSRTYIGLITAQFLAAFNDQAIHASSMFFAIHKGFLSETNAISLMPILFYAPWAIFCTVAGYLADRYSKRSSLVFWKFAEVGITLVALFGFWLGSGGRIPWLPGDHTWYGPLLVLSTVFLMGTHSAFFVPAKYGAMPEILQSHLLSRGNGILESTSFLAVILGTVSGGVLTYWFRNQEYFIGLILVGLAVLGAGASLLLQRMPAANPLRPFPFNVYKPLWGNLRAMIQSRPLRLALLGIAFFTFLVAYMRSTVYMHGESQVPRWTEDETSLRVGTTALGVSLGGLLAGFFSGRKIELGLVPLGALGMIVTTLVAAFFLTDLYVLIACIILIGFFAGFYTLPMFTLLQHRAPKTCKGDSIATSNFINVVGAIVASILFKLLVLGAEISGLAGPPLDPVPIPFQSKSSIYVEHDLHPDELHGELVALEYDRHGRPNKFTVEVRDPLDSSKTMPIDFEARKPKDQPELESSGEHVERERIVVDSDLFDLAGFGLRARGADGEGSQVVVSSYRLRNVNHFLVRAEGKSPRMYDHEFVPRYLFAGAGVITLVILLLLWRELPDFFLRSWIWLHSLHRYRLGVVGVNNMPTDGPAVLATNCGDVERLLHVLSVTDRTTHFLVLDAAPSERLPVVARFLARGTGLNLPLPNPDKPREWEERVAWAARFLEKGQFLVLPVGEEELEILEEHFLRQVEERQPTLILPVYHSSTSGAAPKKKAKGAINVRIVIGAPLPVGTKADLIRAELRRLADGAADRFANGAVTATTVMIPAAAAASPREPATDRPARPL